MMWREPLEAIRVTRRSLSDAWDALIAIAPINLAWVGLSLTVVLFPPATAALFESMHELAAGRTPGSGTTSVSPAAVHRRMGLGAVGRCRDDDCRGERPARSRPVQNRAPGFPAAVAVLGILFGVSVLYVWPFVFLQPDGGLLRAIRNSLLGVLAAPLYSIVLAGLLALIVAARGCADLASRARRPGTHLPRGLACGHRPPPRVEKDPSTTVGRRRSNEHAPRPRRAPR